MNIFHAISSATALFEQGKAVKGATVLTNVEAGSAMLYGVLSAVVELLTTLGVPVIDAAAEIVNAPAATATVIALVFCSDGEQSAVPREPTTKVEMELVFMT